MLSCSSAHSASSLLDHQLSVDPLSLLAVDASSRRLDLDHRPRGASASSLSSLPSLHSIVPVSPSLPVLLPGLAG